MLSVALRLFGLATLGNCLAGGRIEGYCDPLTHVYATRACERRAYENPALGFRSAVWRLSVPGEESQYVGYFVTFDGGARVQIENTYFNATGEVGTLLFDPGSPNERFLRVTTERVSGTGMCVEGKRLVFATRAGQFSSCPADETTETVRLNRLTLLDASDGIWLETVVRVLIIAVRDEQFRLAQLGFLRSIVDSSSLQTAPPASNPVATEICSYPDQKERLMTGFTPPVGMDHALRSWTPAPK